MPAARLAFGLILAAAASAATAPAAAAQQAAGDIRSSQIAVSPGEARLDLELSDGRTRSFALGRGRVLVDGQEVGRYDDGSPLERAWRSLLGEAMEAEGPRLAALLAGWNPPAGTAGAALADALRGAVTAAQVAATAPAPAPQVAELDTVRRLEERLRQLERALERREQRAAPARRAVERRPQPFRHITAGIAGMFSTVMAWLVLALIGGVVVYFGRRYIENVADTARTATLRAWLVGLASTFLVVPIYVLGIIALAISIVGIPLILFWAPLFPIVAVLAVLFGYIAVAHAAGEGLAERRLEGVEWYRQGNSYYYLGTGLALLLGLFFAANFVQMAGPWLGFINGLLNVLAIMLTWLAATIGIGAVVLSRGGTRRPVPVPAVDPDHDPYFEEESHV
jgi:hypothetical protein